MKKELLIGCGSKLIKQLSTTEDKQWNNLTTLDINPDHNPDIIWDLEELPLPFEDETFDEIHAYEVLEHIGRQGDYKFFFAQFAEFYRILKPNGLIHATVPHWQSNWAWGDPSHTRTIQLETLTFLNQQEYINQIGKTSMSDFRYIYKADFNLAAYDIKDGNFAFVLQTVKPSRIENK
jgi:SAM-dependent methyltransferase